MSNKENIMILVQNFPPYDGGRVGASIRAYTLADFLARSGYRVQVCIPKRKVKHRETPQLHSNIKVSQFFSLTQYYDHAQLSFFNLAHKIGYSFVTKLKGLIQSRLPLNNIFERYKVWNISNYCSRLIQRNDVNILITSFPPLYAGEAGKRIKKRFGNTLFWIADFRDLAWLHPRMKKTNNRENERQKRIELSFVNQADAFSVVTEGQMKAIVDTGADSRGNKGRIIENGFAERTADKPQEEMARFVEKVRQENRILIMYAGTGRIADPEERLKGSKTLNCLIDPLLQDPELAKRFALVLQGVIQNSDTFFRNVNSELEYLVLPPVSNEQVRAHMRLCDIGISVNVDVGYSQCRMGGKLYDYISAGLALFVLYAEYPYSIKKFSERHKNKPYFADVFDDGSVKSVLREIAGDPRRLEERKFTAAEAEPYRRDNQYMKFVQLIEEWNR